MTTTQPMTMVGTTTRTTSALLFLCTAAALINTTNAIGSHGRTSIRGKLKVQDTTTETTTTWTVEEDNAKCSGANSRSATTVAGVSACQALANANGHPYISMRPKNTQKFLCYTSASCTAKTGTTLAWQIFHKTVTGDCGGDGNPLHFPLGIDHVLSGRASSMILDVSEVCT